MKEQERIEVNVQLPVEALYNFTRLIEQLRRLSELAGGGAGEPAPRSVDERMESDTFDLARFQALSREPDAPRSVQAPQAAAREAQAVRRTVQRDLPPPDSAGRAASAPAEPAPERAEAPVSTFPEAAESAAPPRREEPLPDPRRQADRPMEELEEGQAAGTGESAPPPQARSVRAEPDTPLAGAPAVRMEPESQIPAAEAVWAEMGERAPDAPTLQAEPGPGAETPLGAGVVVTSGADAPPSRRTDISEELAVPGAAPLTAEAVSLAFRRDGRRYDNGFPLY